MMIKKKPFVIFSLIVLLFVVGILNYNYVLKDDELADSDAIDNDGPINSELVEGNTEEEIMAESKSISKEFFIEYRLERDKNRSQHIALLENIVINKDTDTETRGEAQNE